MARLVYIAQRPLDLEDGSTVAPGEEVKDFDQWAPEAQHALLGLEWVTVSAADEPEPKPAPAVEEPKDATETPKQTPKKTTSKKTTSKK